MIIINATLDGENTYDITVGEDNVYRVSAFDLPSALDLIANHIESKGCNNLYIEHEMMVVMAECSKYLTAEAYAIAHNLTRCGTNGIYLEIVNVKGCPNG
jgi:hypothetical protein